MRGIPLIVATTLTLVACGSAPLRYYTLVKPAAPASAGTVASYAIEVLPVTVPAQVDQPQLVLRTGTGELALAEDRQWLAPIGDEIRAALSAELTRLLGVQDVHGLQQVEGRPVYRVRVDVRRFESSLARQVSIEALWTVAPAQAKTPAISCSIRINHQVSGGYAALIEGHQLALTEIAEQLARTVRSVAMDPQHSACP